jgi:hypothetical protein
LKLPAAAGGLKPSSTAGRLMPSAIRPIALAPMRRIYVPRTEE